MYASLHSTLQLSDILAMLPLWVFRVFDKYDIIVFDDEATQWTNASAVRALTTLPGNQV